MNPAYEPLLTAAKMLAGVCDHASTLDGRGFNGGDAAFGHAMAARSDLTFNMARALKRMLPKYRKQLGDALADQILAITVQDAPCAALAPAAGGSSGPLDVEKLLPWGPPRQIGTRDGVKTIRSADIPFGSPFWALWKERKEDIKKIGVSLRKNEAGTFEATLWPPRNGEARVLHPVAPEPDNAPQPAAVRPEIASKLLDYQVAAVGRLVAALQTYGAALDASDTGTGKTYCALAAAKQLGLKPVVMCPKSVRPSWVKAAEKHFQMEIFVSNYEQFKLGKTPYCEAVKVTRTRKDGKPVVDKKTKKPVVDTFFKWNLPKDALLIIDECHRVGAINTLNSDIAVAAKDAGAKTMLLSATAADSPLSMRAIGYVLGLFPKVRDFYSFCFKNGVVRGRFGLEFTGGQAAMKRIHHQIFGSGEGNRLRIADIPGFPETRIIPEVVDFDNAVEIQRAYADMEDALSRLAEHEKKDRQGIVLTEILRARQRTELLKVPTLVQMAKDAEAEGMSVAIFVNFEETLQAVCKALDTDCIISGSQHGDKGDAEREANIQRFQRGDYPRMSIINICFSAKAVRQACGRVHRAVDKNEAPQWSADCSRFIVCNINAGGVGVSLHHLGGKPSIQRIPFASGTVEESAAEAVERKIANIELLNNGDVLNGMKILGCDVEQLDYQTK